MTYLRLARQAIRSAPLLRTLHLKAHALPGHQFLRVFQPPVERLRRPAQARLGELVRVAIARQAAHAPARQAAMRR